MCELLGISVSPAAELGLWFKAFAPRAEHNAHGWGVGWYEHGEARLVKEPSRADQSERAATLAADPPTSDVFVVHVRAATIGDLTEQNTHPFRARLAGRDWLFAHNGTVNDLDQFPVGKYRREGQTDSEVAFHFLLARLERLGRRATDAEVTADLFTGARAVPISEQDPWMPLKPGEMLVCRDGLLLDHLVAPGAPTRAAS